MSDHRSPCSTCPWRVGVDAWAIGRDHHPEIPPLHRAQMVDIARRQNQGFGAPVMACHLTHAGEDAISPQERTCVGFALQVGKENLLYRLLLINGKVRPEEYECAEPLHPSFEAMLRANPARGRKARRV